MFKVHALGLEPLGGNDIVLPIYLPLCSDSQKINRIKWSHATRSKGQRANIGAKTQGLGTDGPNLVRDLGPVTYFMKEQNLPSLLFPSHGTTWEKLCERNCVEIFFFQILFPGIFFCGRGMLWANMIKQM